MLSALSEKRLRPERLGMLPTTLIGLDGATFVVLDSLMADGHMPFLKSFIDEGVRAELLSTPHPLTPPAWTTVMTGRNPGNHGIYDFLRSEVSNQGAFFTLNNFRNIHCETLWTLISRLGGRIISVNFPLMAPPPAVAGAIVPGLLSWRHLRRNIYPPEAYDDLKSLPGFNAREFSWDFEMETSVQYLKEEELDPWIRFHIGREQHWFNIIRRLMETQRADFTAVMFDGIDKLQHACWRFLDPGLTPTLPNAHERRLRDLCLEYFRALDSFLRQIVELAGPRANVFMVSDHGFGPCWRSFRINKWLEQQGYLKWPADGLPPNKRPSNTHFVNLDWARTQVYCQSAATNGVHIRVKQQPDDPGVTPEQYLPFRDRLEKQLRAVIDPLTQAPFFKDVLKRELAYPGTYMSNAPDLTLVPYDHGFVSVLNAEPVIWVRPTVMSTHYPVGILLARGPTLGKSKSIPMQSILDVAPTMLHSLELPVPLDYEGRVIGAIFDEAYWQQHPVTTGPATTSPDQFGAAKAAREVDNNEEEVILNRLRALGYVE
jgi:predicted AlkP superfamily phosphohydrolase/phosphomutase